MKKSLRELIYFGFILYFGLLAQRAFAEENWKDANATVKMKVSVYCCKPEYIGLLGIGSFFQTRLRSSILVISYPKTLALD